MFATHRKKIMFLWFHKVWKRYPHCCWQEYWKKEELTVTCLVQHWTEVVNMENPFYQFFLSDSLYYLINSYYCLVQLIRYPVWLIHHELTRFWYTEINLFFLRYYSWKSKSTGGKKQQTKIYLVLLVPWWAFSLSIKSKFWLERSNFKRSHRGAMWPLFINSHVRMCVTFLHFSFSRFRQHIPFLWFIAK